MFSDTLQIRQTKKRRRPRRHVGPAPGRLARRPRSPRSRGPAKSADSGPAVHHDNGAGWQQVPSAITAGHSSTLTLISKDDAYTGDLTCTRYDDATAA
ncbi:MULTISPECIES: hypothetical protein [unclassified Streptomyces]|uniref:hypothetical protein n=1 Tax=unclassified Streptomyces TaxID=2593676 RepID=UPI00380EC171